MFLSLRPSYILAFVQRAKDSSTGGNNKCHGMLKVSACKKKETGLSLEAAEEAFNNTANIVIATTARATSTAAAAAVTAEGSSSLLSPPPPKDRDMAVKFRGYRESLAMRYSHPESKVSRGRAGQGRAGQGSGLIPSKAHCDVHLCLK